VSGRHRYSRADLDELKEKSRTEVLEIFGSFEDRNLEENAFIRQAVGLVDPGRVPGLKAAIDGNDIAAAAAAVLTACHTSQNEPSSDKPSTVHVADEVLGNRFTFYGEPHHLPDDIDWDFNPGTRHWGMDLNRFSYLAPLTDAHLQTGDERYARKAIDLILDWIQKCDIERCFEGTPYVFGSYLNNTIHCSGWASCIRALIPTGHVKPVELLRILKSLHEQIGYLEVVTNGHAGNWPTIGCQGVLATLAALPVFRDVDRFTTYFIDTLGAQVEEQILPDGVQDELTPHYHSVVVNNILTCAESCSKLGLSLEPRTLDTLRRMVRYQEQTVTPGRTAHVAFNDSDPESVPNVGDRLRRIGLGEYIPDPESLGPEAYPYAGVAFLRQPPKDGDLYMAFDGGPFGRSHQHEDKLGFWIHAYGRDLIVDPGRHLYDRTEVSYLPYLVTTHAHSTITVDGEDQNSRAHRKTWIADSPGSLTFTKSENETRASARYDLGYGADNAIDVTHHREVVFVSGQFWILFDTVSDNTGSGSHRINSRFQFAPGDVTLTGAQASTQFEDANIAVLPTGDWDARILKGEENPRAGWYSASYNKIEPAPALSLTREIELPLKYAVLLFPYRGKTAPDLTLSFDGAEATVSIDGKLHTVSSSN
jgi:hypothetical protein|tara:strand:- start:1200 stop:3143 length:1944 start_codon:yes stop_codon:yes gene_type:complete